MLHGSIPALVTPFNNGAIDFATFEKLIERQIAEGSAGLVPMGTTGESATVSHEEHRKVTEACIEIARKRVPIIAGCGSNATAEAVELVQHAKKAGADAALVVVPYYNKPSQEGMIRHFTAVAELGGLPVIIYNIPGRSVVDMSVATMAALSRVPGIIGVKDSHGDITRASAQRGACAPAFLQICGNDDMALAHAVSGAVGCISVTANVAPRECAAFQAACAAGDFARALALNDQLFPLHQALFTDASPGPTKYAMSRLGLCTTEMRLPLCGPSEASRAAVDAALAHAGLI